LRRASRKSFSPACIPSGIQRSITVRPTVVSGTPSRTVTWSAIDNECETWSPSYCRIPLLPARVTVTNQDGSRSRPQAAAALAWLSQVCGVVSVAARHRCCGVIGAAPVRNTPSWTLRTAADHQVAASGVIPAARSCQRATSPSWVAAIRSGRDRRGARFTPLLGASDQDSPPFPRRAGIRPRYGADGFRFGGEMLGTRSTSGSATLLHGDVAIRPFGLGVSEVPPAQTVDVVSEALRLGSRQIDTAAVCRDEAQVGAAFARRATGATRSPSPPVLQRQPSPPRRGTRWVRAGRSKTR